MNIRESQISYLKQFYTDEELDTLGCSDDATLQELWDYSQPVDMDIDALGFVNEGGVTLVDSPDGWVPIEQFRNKGTKQCYQVVLANGTSITASHDHLFQRPNDDWAFTSDLKVGESLLAKYGPSTIIMVKDVGYHQVYDLSIDHKNHRYYTNDVSSHNSGKSLFLQNLALNWSFMGMDVVYFSLELSEALVSSRLDCMVSNMGTKELFKRVADASMAIKMTQKTSKAGKITVKKMPEAGTTTNLLRSYLKEYEIQMGKKPDAVIVDYLDIMYPNNSKIDPTNAFAKDKYVSEELRCMYSELDLLGASASQLNRSAVEAGNSGGNFDHSHIAGGISKINTADNVFAIYTNAAMKERGEYQLYMLKTRSSAAVGQNITLAYNNVTMLISDMDDEANSHVPMTQAQLQQSLKASLNQAKQVPNLGTVAKATTNATINVHPALPTPSSTPPWEDEPDTAVAAPPPPPPPAAPNEARNRLMGLLSKVQKK